MDADSTDNPMNVTEFQSNQAKNRISAIESKRLLWNSCCHALQVDKTLRSASSCNIEYPAGFIDHSIIKCKMLKFLVFRWVTLGKSDLDIGTSGDCVEILEYLYFDIEVGKNNHQQHVFYWEK